MRSSYAIWRMLSSRTRANWRLTAVLLLGILVAATLLAAAPVYARAMADLGLTFAIRDRLETTPATQVLLRNVELNTEDGQRLQEAVRGRADERLGWYTGAREQIVQGPKFGIVKEPDAPLRQHRIAALFSLTGAELNLTASEGRLPRPMSETSGVIEFAMSARTASFSLLKVGDRVPLLERYDDCAREIPRMDAPPPPPCNATVGLRQQLQGQFVGIVEPLDAESSFWARPWFAISGIADQGPETGIAMSALVSTGTMEELSRRFPSYRAEITYNLFADIDKLTRQNYERARDDIPALRRDLEPLGAFAFSSLEDTLRGFGRELNYQQTPLLLLLLQIAGIALFYVAIVSFIVIERQAAEITLLRSRGAGLGQILGVYVFEGLLLGVPIVLIAPLLATLATALLGRLPAFQRVADGALLPARVLPASFGLAMLGVGLSLVMLLGAVAIAARGSAVAQRRAMARPAAAFIQRYYLDIAVLAIAALLLWEMNERGSAFTPGNAGGLSNDPLLLLSPALLTLGAAALVLRLYPLVLRLVQLVAGAVVPAALSLGLKQVTRNSGQYVRLALLLMMAVATGTFAASYASTAERSFRDRAAFESGVDLRGIIGESSGLSDAEVEQRLRTQPGVTNAATVLRLNGVLATPGEGRQDLQLLGVNPEAARDLLWFRDDLATDTLATLMATISGPAPKGRLIPGNPQALTMWVNPTDLRELSTLWARVRDANGTIALAEFGKLDFTGWRQMRAPLTGQFFPKLVAPVAVASLIVSQPGNTNIQQSGPIYLDDLMAEGGDGAASVVEDFEGVVRWAVAPVRQPLRGQPQTDEFRIANEQVKNGVAAGRLQLRSGAINTTRGIASTDLLSPIPVVANEAFVALTGAGPGNRTIIEVNGVLTPVTVQAVTRLFPTVSRGTPLVVANREQLLSWLAAFVETVLPRPNEGWVQLDPAADRDQVRRALTVADPRLTNHTDRVRVLKSVNQNPLVAAGGSGILLVASLGVLALIAAALLVTLITSVQARRTEFAVLAALGLSRAQMLVILAFEYALVALVGVLGGIVLGRAIGRRMLSFLEVNSSGQPVVPPFILQTDWPAVGAAAAVIGLTFLAGMVLCTRWVARQVSGQALRGTE